MPINGKEIVINTFENGLNKDFNDSLIPNGAYKNAKNMVQVSQKGDLFILTNERGTEEKLTFPVGYSVIGRYVLEQDVIFWLVNTSTGDCEVGIVDSDFVYHTKVNDISYVQKFNFSIEKEIQARGRINYKGDRIVYWVDKLNKPRILNLGSDNSVLSFTNLDEETTLLFQFDLPYISFDSGDGDGLLDSGSLTCGIYQLAVRLVTQDLNTTTFGFISNSIPIGDELLSGGRDNYDGGNANTNANKSIKYTIKNIDQDFPFIEVAAVKFDPTSNIPIIQIINRYSVTGSTMQLIFDGTYNGSIITLDELTAEHISYNSAGAIEQKDGRLFLANLTSQEQDDLQELANNINVGYKIEEVEYKQYRTPNDNVSSGVSYTDALDGSALNYFDDYKGPHLHHNKPTYKRGEVYSLAIGVVYKDGSISSAFPIPGAERSLNTNTSATRSSGGDSNAKGTLGTYVSTLTTSLYDFGGSYGTRIRHHLMPELTLEPHFRLDGSTEYIRLLQLIFTPNVTANSIITGLNNKIKGFYFVRQTRDKIQNKSIFAQGIYNPFDYFERTDGEVSNVYGTPPGTYSEIPLFGATNWVGTPAQNITLAFGQRKNVGFNSNDQTLLAAFYSAENIFDSNKIVSGTKLSPKLEIQGSIKQLGAGISNYDNGASPSNQNPLYGHYYCSYDVENRGTVMPFSDTTITSKYFYSSTQDAYHNGGGERLKRTRTLGSNDKFVENNGSEGYLLLELNSGVYKYPTSDISIQFDAVSNDVINYPSSKVSKRILSELITPNTEQYGTLEGAEYQLIGFTFDLFNSTSPLELYGGDTYISKFTFKVSKNIPYIYQSTGGSNPWVDFDRGFTFRPDHGAELRAVSHVFIESELNTWYRYVVTNGYGYWPKITRISNMKNDSTTTFQDVGGSNDFGLLDFFPNEADSYNFQYSIQNSLKKYFSTPLGLVPINQFPTRIAYSAQLLQGEQIDQYRVFMANNYTDLPKNRGEITNLFQWNNELFAHTKDSLWQTYANTQVGIESSEGGYIVGTGGVFVKPATEVLTLDNGYGGCQNFQTAVATPYGYFFVDYNQKKLYLYKTQLEDITLKSGIWRYFKDNISVGDSTLSNKDTNYGNPANFNSGKNGLLTVFDPNLRRIILIQRDGRNTNNLSFSISLNLLSQKWIANHDYAEDSNDYGLLSYFIGDYAFLVKNTSGSSILYRLDTGDFGYYFGERKDSTIEVSVNIEPKINKVFDNLFIDSISTNENEVGEPVVVFDTFNFLQVYNDKTNSDSQDLGTYQLVVSNTLGSGNTKYRNNQYQLGLPKNLVKNPNVDIFDSSNLYLSSQTSFKERLNGKYIILKLIYNNINNYRLTLRSLSTVIRKYIR